MTRTAPRSLARVFVAFRAGSTRGRRLELRGGVPLPRILRHDPHVRHRRHPRLDAFAVPALLRRDARGDPAARAGRRGNACRARRRDGHAPARGHRPRDRQPAARRTRRPSARLPERRDLQLSRAARDLERAGCVFATAERHRDPGPGLSTTGASTGFSRASTACTRSRCSTATRACCTSRATASAKSRSFMPRRTAASPTARILGTLAALPWVGAELDPLSLQRYLALHYVPGDATIYRHVRRVLPGERLEIPLDCARSRSACATTCRRSARRLRSPTMRSRYSSSTRSRRGSSPTCRSACSCPADSTARSSPPRGAPSARRAHVLDGIRVRRARRERVRTRARDRDRQPPSSFPVRRSELRDVAAGGGGRSRRAGRRSGAAARSTGSHARRAGTRPSCCRAKAPTRCSRATATTLRSRRMPGCCRHGQARARGSRSDDRAIA